MPLDSTPFKPLAESKATPVNGSSALQTPVQPETLQQRDKRLREEHFAQRAPKGRRVSYGNEDR
jgi:hypothetical protein